jgi:hypothetical protein
MPSTSGTIFQATCELEFDADRFRRLDDLKAAEVYETALRRFVSEGSPQWWWEHFTMSTSLPFEAGDAWTKLAGLVPDPTEKVCFIADDDGSPGYSVWEADVRDIAAVVGECSAFEYYIVEKGFGWLLCENHHDVLIGVGAQVEEKLLASRLDFDLTNGKQ